MRKLFLSTLALASSLFASEKVYTPYFELVNVHSDYQFASAKLLKSYVDGAGKYQLELPPRSDSLVHQPAPDSVRKLAQAQGCPKYLLGDLTRLGESVIVSFALYNAADGSLVWSDRLKAAGPDDLDPILQKLARNLGTLNSAQTDGNIYSVTQQDSKRLRQKQSNNSFGATIGGTWLPKYPMSGFLGGMGINWLYDNRNLLVQMDAKFQGFDGDDDESASLFDFGISAYYPFLDKDWTPFLGGGVSYGVISYSRPDTESSSTDYYDYYSESEDKNGLLFHAGGGLLFSRTSTVNLRLRTEYMVSSFKVDNHVSQGLWVGVDAGFSR
jgi:hypothetical protein